MRILIIPSWYPTPRRPINGVFVREQADALSHTHEVRVLYLDVLPRGWHRRSSSRVSTERGYVEDTIEVPNYPLIWQFIYLAYLGRAYWKLRAQFKPDVVHCHVAVPSGWGVALLRRLFRAPIVLTEHTGQFEVWRARCGLRWMAHVAMSAADVVIAVGERQKQDLIENSPAIKRLEIVSNVVNTNLFQPSPLPPASEGYHILFVGILDSPWVKGVSVLLKATALLKQSNLPVHLDLVGGGNLLAEYKAQAKHLGVDDVVSFHGAQPHEAVAQFFRKSHLYVMSSLTESQSLVVIEALASGRPVVSTRCGGPEYMINSTNGLIVEPGQAEPLAAAITELLTHLDRYDPQSIAADAARLYSQVTITEALTAIYQRLGREL
ncbi:MAG: glycosyltransferase [Chloroflexi bacterium]|nr:glycosyltransferase [Chloroflexota bacterium]